jgi:hypothetical protein
MPGRQVSQRINAKSVTARINQKETKQASIMLWTTSGDPYEILLSTVALRRLQTSIASAICSLPTSQD